MELTIETARNNMLEWWDIFSTTGDIYDCMEWLASYREYDLLLDSQNEMEM